MDNNPAAQLHSEVDLKLSRELYSSLRMLRGVLTKEAGEGVMAHHIFGNATLQQISKRIPRSKEELLEINGIGKDKIRRYGDRVLETVEACIRDHHKQDKNGSDSKRRRHAAAANDDDDDDDDDRILSKKRNKNPQAVDVNVTGGFVKKIEITVHIHGR